MVELTPGLDNIFACLSDPTRRDILRLVSRRDMSVGQIAGHYELTFAAIAKHLKVLERSGLVTKRRQGKEQIAALAPQGLAAADGYLRNFEKHWAKRLNNLDEYLSSIKK